MISEFLLNHLWQSTVFAAAAALLTLLFRKNPARVRYALWLAASIKFLIPFSLFIAIGSSIDFGRQQAASIVQPAVAIVEGFSQPFGSTSLETQIPATVKPDRSHLFWMVVSTIWVGGCLAVLAFYLAKIRRMRAVDRKAELIKQGRAFEMLQRLEQIHGRRFLIKMKSSNSLMEPGVFGIFRPVLLIPSGMPDRLNDSELEAVIAHEIFHVRRRDNLVAAIHMFIEALFWFHPMVCWLGAKLVQERERACDEEVLLLGKDPQAYAEGILKVCEFCIESPLACIAGVTGADMKKRIQAIMCRHIGARMGWTKRLLLTGIGIGVLAIPIMIGLLNAPVMNAQTQKPAESKNPISGTTSTSNGEAAPAPDAVYVPTMTFDVTSVREIKPDVQGRFFIGFSPQNSRNVQLTNNLLLNLVMWAYDVKHYQIEGIPREFGGTMFNVEAKTDSATDERLAKLTKEQVRLEQAHMRQALLAERFKLKVHWETRNGETYDLFVAKAGRLKSTGESPSAEEMKKFGDRPIPRLYQQGSSMRGFEYAAHGATIADIVQMLSGQFGRPVADKTGLTGKYDFNLKYYQVLESQRKDDETNPWLPLETAIQDQLGLKLKPSHGPVQRLIIDHIEKPSEN
jgi:uncharacterized protein (TIGR03435 family)